MLNLKSIYLLYIRYLFTLRVVVVVVVVVVWTVTASLTLSDPFLSMVTVRKVGIYH